MLDGREDHDLCPVVQELRGLFEECGVVLVAFDSRTAGAAAACRPWAGGARPRGAARESRAGKFFGKPPIKKPGRKPVLSNNQAANEVVVGLAMRARDHQRRRAFEHEAIERARDVRVR